MGNVKGSGDNFQVVWWSWSTVWNKYSNIVFDQRQKFNDLEPNSSLNPKSDLHLIPPHSNTAESFVKRIKEMITNFALIVKLILLVNLKGNYGEDGYWC